MASIRILGFDYEIKMAPSPEDGGMLDAARCNTAKQIIILDTSISIAMQKSALLHETIEALNYHLELNLTDHRAIAELESGLFAVLRDNPGIFEVTK
jgi:hypothetical protein